MVLSVDVGGIAVHAAARVMAQCGANEVFVLRVATDLVASAGLKFTERGAFDLKGIPGHWDYSPALRAANCASPAQSASSLPRATASMK